MSEIGENDVQTDVLESRLQKTQNAFAKSTDLSKKIGTEQYEGLAKYTPPEPGSNNYLKDLIATTLASSRVNKALHEKTLPYLQDLSENLKDQIEKRRQLLSEGVELQMALAELTELKDYVTNPDIFNLIKDRLNHIKNGLELTDLDGKATHNPENNNDSTSPNKTTERNLDHQKQYISLENGPSPELESIDRLAALEFIAKKKPFSELLEFLNLSSNGKEFSIEDAEKLINSMFTKLFSDITRGNPTANQTKIFHEIRNVSANSDTNAFREIFRKFIKSYFHNVNFFEAPRMPEANKTDTNSKTKEKPKRTPIDPNGLIIEVLDRISARGIKLNSSQRFNPLQAIEIFGTTQEVERKALEERYITPQKRDGNDYHPAYNLTEAITLAVIKKYTGATKEQIEQLPSLIENALQKWMKDHPESISSK